MSCNTQCINKFLYYIYFRDYSYTIGYCPGTLSGNLRLMFPFLTFLAYKVPVIMSGNISRVCSTQKLRKRAFFYFFYYFGSACLLTQNLINLISGGNQKDLAYVFCDCWSQLSMLLSIFCQFNTNYLIIYSSR